MPTTATNLSDRLASVVSADCIERNTAARSHYTIDGLTPSAAVKPATSAEAAEVVRFALKENFAIIPCGGRSKLQIGNIPARYDIALDMAALNRIAHYDPGDLTVSIDAGCTLKIIAATLHPQNQFLPLPSAYGENATVAGTIASGVDSHLRQYYGTARDFLVGAEFIDGTGAQCKSGGRVVKNVTGYDLHKLLIGSLGTLGIITRLNFRTFPSLNSHGSQIETFTADFADAKSAIEFRHKIAASPFTPDAIEILSPETVAIIDSSAQSNLPAQSKSWQVVVAFHGKPELRARYVKAMSEFSNQAGNNISSSSGEPPAFHAIANLRRSTPFATIFKMTQLPEKLPELFAALRATAEQAHIPHALVARAVGVTYFALLPADPSIHLAQAQLQAALDPRDVGQMLDGEHKQIFSALRDIAAKIFVMCSEKTAAAQIVFAPTQLKRELPALGADRPDAAAMRKLKAAFDPQNIFAPARLL
jgi:glycolate oxidase FAD binding subunit